MNMIARAAAALARSVQRAGGVVVEIRRGGHVISPITATLTVVDHQVADESTGVPTLLKSSDWVFIASELLLGGKPFTFRAGDTITWGTRVFEVQPIPGRKAYEPHDAAGLIVVVHSKELTSDECC